MGALVTLEQARTHLRVFVHDDDEDIYLKVVQASAIVVDYLGDRANVPIGITSSTVASPSTLITTDDPHGFTTGMTVVITDHADSVPSLDGSHVITVVDTESFTIPESVTTAGTGGLATGQWTPETVPGPVQSAVLLMLTHLHENRGNDMQADDAVWSAVARLLTRSRTAALA